MWEDIPYPAGKAELSVSAVKEEGKKDEGAQDLGLVFGRPACRWIEAGEIFAHGVKVKREELAAFCGIAFPELHPEGRWEAGFQVIKIGVILCMGLP